MKIKTHPFHPFKLQTSELHWCVLNYPNSAITNVGHFGVCLFVCFPLSSHFSVKKLQKWKKC